MSQTFSLDAMQERKLASFLKEQHAKLKEGTSFGAIGGSCTYEFTPTSLGTVCRVIFCHGMPYEATIDLTDYESW
jgi:hypothetical protein